MAELSNYSPSTKDRLVAALADRLGGDRAAYAKANSLVGNNDPVKQAALDAAHTGAYFTPAALPVAAYDIGSAVADPVKRIAQMLTGGNDHPITQGPEMTRDQFYAAHRHPMKSKEDILSDELTSLKASGNYQEAGPKNRAKLEMEAARRADQRYSAQAASGADEEARINQDWNAELADRKARADALARKPWYERNPGLGDAAMYGGSIASGLLAARGYGKIAKEGANLLADVQAARTAGDIGQEANALHALNAYRSSVPLEYGKVAAKTALIPSEARSVGTGYDALLMPEIRDDQGNVDPTSARQQARSLIARSLTTGGGFAEEFGPSLAAGVTASALGSLAAKKPPMANIKAEGGYLSGFPGGSGASPDALAIPLGDARLRAIEKQREIAAALRGEPTPRGQQVEQPQISLSPQAPTLTGAPGGRSGFANTLPSPSGEATAAALSDSATTPAANALARSAIAKALVETPSLPAPPKRMIGGTHPDHDWDAKSGRWRDVDGQYLRGPAPKDAE